VSGTGFRSDYDLFLLERKSQNDTVTAGRQASNPGRNGGHEDKLSDGPKVWKGVFPDINPDGNFTALSRW